MAIIHYFPRYSQKENMVTNNMLLLFSRLYNHNNDQFNQFINLILEDKNIELNTSIRFGQQERGQGSVPDAVIEQESFKVVIETKLYSQVNFEQVKKHVSSFANEDKKIFLWINTEPIDGNYRKQIINYLNKANEKDKNIKINFASTTFRDICRCFNEVILDYDNEMHELIRDFEGFCNEQGLINNADSKMRVVLAGNTFEQNMEHNIYYAPKERGYQKHRYLGIYKQKAVRGIGEVFASADISYNEETGELVVKETQTDITEDQKETIKKVIIEARARYGYDLAENHRFFFVEKFHETEFTKPSKGGLMGQRYFDLADIEGYSEDRKCDEIAKWLKGKSWDK